VGTDISTAIHTARIKRTMTIDPPVHEPTARVRVQEIGVAGMPLLRLLQLSSPSLPIGAFAYSQGLEQAVALHWAFDEASAGHWIVGLLSHGLGRLDLPVLIRLHRAFADEDLVAFRRWNQFLFASRGSSELQAEDRHLGGALARVLHGLGIEAASAWIADPCATHAALFALAAVRWNIQATAMAAGYAFAWTEAQVGAATRLCPLGQQAAQRILTRALPVIDGVVGEAFLLADDDLGASAPAHAIASALHETLYSRLCRS